MVCSNISWQFFFLCLCLLMVLYYGFIYGYFYQKGLRLSKARPFIPATKLTQELIANTDAIHSIESLLDRVAGSPKAEVLYALQQILKTTGRDNGVFQSKIETLIQSKLEQKGIEKLTTEELATLWHA